MSQLPELGSTINLSDFCQRKWALDSSGKFRNAMSVTAPINLPNPIGYVDRSISVNAAKAVDPVLKNKRGWDIALEPIKQVPMNLIVLWMAGNSISPFPIMMIVMMLPRPLQAIFGIGSVFKKIEGGQVNLQCFVYLMGNFAIILLAIYKFHSMGLLPTYSSDWLAFIEQSPVSFTPHFTHLSLEFRMVLRKRPLNTTCKI
ncbi:ER membrane protein complex subunit 4 [Cichlidogyrus casuarinus]|uniref:ER membrane protein complex subunit 4 n=1 Tax=Cichlidogyrus casuarinus TaxID=1844966 RepID=A0ABD2Q4H2_9PLAT